ncbi:MAG: hypothetical protein ACR2H5_08350 [Ktedonobacteraceae bacterium]
MTQDPARRSPSTYKRSARAGRNKPMLVTSPENEENKENELEDALPTLEESQSEVQEPVQAVQAARPGRRLPSFFSTVGKKAPTASSQEIDATQARLARATRTKGTVAKAPTETKSVAKAEPKKEPAKASTPARPASAFKTKYFIGMGIYLLGANFIGIGESSFFAANHLDAVLTTFNLFGGTIVIKTSTLAFLATLVILLVLLARFDLIPRSFSALSGNPPAKKGSSNSTARNSQNTVEGSRVAPPTMKQGVKGKHDNLYQEYRANQRRDRKK